MYGGGRRRREQWESEDDDEYPSLSLGSADPLPMQDLAERKEESDVGGIVRQVDVDVVYHDQLGQAITTDQRVQDAREAV